VVDVASYALERGLRLLGEGSFLYHAPCHDSLDGKATKVLKDIGGFGSVQSVPHCCSEAGTLSLSRPDITDSMLHRKQAALAEAIGELQKVTVLTNCPSCVQGLGRSRGLGVEPKHIAVALAEKFSGAGWKEQFLSQASRATAIAF
jgi:Fe-S oxidoreductase